MRVRAMTWLCLAPLVGIAQYYGMDTTWHHDGFVIGAPELGVSHGDGLAIRPEGAVACGLYQSAGTSGVFLAGYDAAGNVDPGFGLNGYVFLPQHGTPIMVNGANGTFLVSTSTLLGSSGVIIVSRFLSNGDLDPGFGSNGSTVVDVTGMNDTPLDLAMESDRVVVLASAPNGTSRCFRLDASGQLDVAFGTGGYTAAMTGSVPSAVATHPSGRILVAGGGWTNPIWVSCFGPDGQLATSFGQNGSIEDLDNFNLGGSVGDMRALPDGDILLAGHLWATGATNSEDMYLLRLQSDGTRDTSFATNGLLIPQYGNHQRARSIALQSSGHIVVAGYYYPNSASGSRGWTAFRCSQEGWIDPQYANGLVYAPGIQPFAPEPYTCYSYGSMVVDGADRVLLVGDVSSTGMSNLGVARLLALLGPVSVEDEGLAARLMVYPNPCSDQLFIELPDASWDEWTVACFDALGRSVEAPRLSGPELSGRSAFSVSAWPPGMYQVVVSGRQGRRVSVFYKQ